MPRGRRPPENGKLQEICDHVPVDGGAIAVEPERRGTDSATVRELAAGPGLLLVRPDGYLAAAARAAAPEPVAEWRRAGSLPPIVRSRLRPYG
ncbi:MULTISPECIES: hypothetical protein [unclassified Saccharopolyspora]|uniref:hypothetical protein n=1 Tax=unclassified Saccharopolyspora TaxID=2646250 RepID=UPI001CD431B2|nr:MULTISPECIES: hypothetical protein [unclassified Saccharopolyspora]MCA1188442.1 hypothetical protein [Saccharopolyspora sp. 6T]MCA1192768.1 hypothetical protein [Saccharopolyspora sp. 6V]MCA1225385.1 hypothetical protein [Saccharopolyspora sp. 6M]MCA1279468.1 hypothetical protein [Saccharopolyspora sp. 7B]